MVLRYELCTDSRVERVALVIERGDSPWDGNDTILWEIVSPRGTTHSVFPLGDVPRGFREVTPLRRPLPRDLPLAALVETTTAAVALDFRLPELRRDMIYTFEGRNTRPAVFEDAANEVCR